LKDAACQSKIQAVIKVFRLSIDFPTITLPFFLGHNKSAAAKVMFRNLIGALVVISDVEAKLFADLFRSCIV